MVDREGNVLRPPSRKIGDPAGGEEILASYARFTQKGCTLASGQGVLEAGTFLAKSGKKYVKYAGGGGNAEADEVQTVTEGGSGLTSFTLTFSGQTTGAIAAAATAATVQTALEALSNVGAGNVTVTGSAGGPYTVTFVGDLADTNVAQMTATPTGGSGTVTVATTTAGTGDASGFCLGFLRNGVDTTDGDMLGNIVMSGIVKASVVANAQGGGASVTDVAADLNGRYDPDFDWFIF